MENRGANTSIDLNKAMADIHKSSQIYSGLGTPGITLSTVYGSEKIIPAGITRNEYDVLYKTLSKMAVSSGSEEIGLQALKLQALLGATVGRPNL